MILFTFVFNKHICFKFYDQKKTYKTGRVLTWATASSLFSHTSLYFPSPLWSENTSHEKTRNIKRTPSTNPNTLIVSVLFHMKMGPVCHKYFARRNDVISAKKSKSQVFDWLPCFCNLRPDGFLGTLDIKLEMRLELFNM